MKIRVTLRDGAGIRDGIMESVRGTLPEGLSKSKETDVEDTRFRLQSELMRRWVTGCECVSIEFDTVSGMATVVERNQ